MPETRRAGTGSSEHLGGANQRLQRTAARAGEVISGQRSIKPSQAVYLAIGIARLHLHLHAGARYTLRVSTPSFQTAVAVKPLALLKTRGGPCLLRPTPVAPVYSNGFRRTYPLAVHVLQQGLYLVRSNRPDKLRAA